MLLESKSYTIDDLKLFDLLHFFYMFFSLDTKVIIKNSFWDKSFEIRLRDLDDVKNETMRLLHDTKVFSFGCQPDVIEKKLSVFISC